VKRVLATIIVGAIGLTACGGSAVKTDASKSATPKPVEAAVLTKASQATTDANSARLVMTMTATDFDDGGDGGVKIDGVVDFANGNADLTATGAGSIGEAFEESIRIVVVDKSAYLEVSDAIRAEHDISTRWVKATAQRIGIGGGDDPASGLTNFLEPAAILKGLEAVTSGVTGTENVERNGVNTTHYETKLKFSDFMKKAAKGDDAGGLAQGFLEFFTPLVLPLDVWVDDDGRVVEFNLTMDLSAIINAFDELDDSDDSTSTTVSTKEPTMTVILKLSDYGTEVNVEAPPAAEVSELPAGSDLFAGDSPDESDTNYPGCAQSKRDTVRTAIAAHRAMTANNAAEPTLQDLVDANLLAVVPDDVTLTWNDGVSTITADC
jgi:hypothetical protein